MPLPAFLVPEQTVSSSGEGPALELDPDAAGLLELTLGIADVLEQQSLDVNIHGSADGSAWTPKPIAAFPQKFYPGVSKIVLDLSKYPGTRFLRAQWKVNRWGHWQSPPVFRFFVFVEPAS